MASNLYDASILQDFTVWIREVGKIGECPNFQPPEIKLAMEDYRGGGMDGTVEIAHGIEKIEFEFDMFTWDPQIWEEMGYGPGAMNCFIDFRGYLLSPGGEEKGVMIQTTSQIKSIKTGKVEPGKKTEVTVGISCHKYAHTIGGKTVMSIDVFRKKYVVNGNDRFSRARDFLGFSY